MPIDQADLVVDTINAPLAVQKGASFDFSYVVKNTGTGAASSSQAAFVLDDMSSQPSIEAIFIVDPLAAGSTTTVTTSLYTSSLSVGQHTLYVVADRAGTLSESDETNNWRAFTFNVTAPPTTPDVIVQTLTTADSVLQQGERLDFSYMVGSLGAGFANLARVAYWIDTDPVLGFRAYNMPSGYSDAGPYSDDVSTYALTPGQHTLWVDADYFDDVAESNESNNRASLTFTVTAGPRPDLVVSSITAAPIVAQGSLLNFSYVIENIGTHSAALSYASYRIDGQGNEILQTVDSVAAGASRTLSRTIDTSSLGLGQHTLLLRADAPDGIAETYETNNLRSVTFTVSATGQSDLVVSNVQANASVVQGEAFDVSYIVTNGGTASSEISWAGLSVDQVPTQSNIAAVHVANSLAVGGSQTLTSRIDTSTLSVGQHTLWISADFTGLVAESDETNNATSVTFTVTASPRPDLVVSNLGLGSASVVQGQNLGFVYTIVNDGAAQSNLGYGGFYIDGMTEAHFRGSNVTDPLGSGASRTLFNGFNTANLSVGQHTLWVGADNFGQTSESNESNNWRSITFEVTAPPRADLLVSSLGLGSASVVQGQNLGFVYTIVNDGAAQSNLGYANFYIDGWSEAYFRGSNVTDPLGVGASRTIFNGFNTADLSVGQHTLWIGADNFGQTTESNESNNWRSITFEVTAPPRADLVVSNLGLGSTSVVQGQNLGFVYTIVNDGAAQSNLGYANFYIDGWSEAYFRGSNVTDPLGVGASRTIFNGFNTADLSVGQHTLWIGADNFGQTSESNESNNWRSITFEVTAPPRADLLVSSLGLGSTSVVQGQALGFVYTIVNDGGAQSNLGYANFYIDGWSEAYFRGSNVTDPLGVGASRTIFNGFNTADLSVGQHTLWIGADNFGQTSESNESNNWRSITFEVTAPPRADLVVSNLGLGSTSVVQGQALGFAYTIVNDGAAQSNLGYANFYIDGMTEAHFRGSNVTDPLGVGASRTIFNGFNTADLSVGQHTLWIGADNFGQTSESNESNNWRSITFEVTAPLLADLVVSSLALGSASVSRGQDLGFVYTIVNNGVGQSNLGYANFYIDGFSEAHFRGSNVTDPLGVGASRTIFNGFNTADLSVGQHTLWIGADNFGQTTESNESNNWRAITFEVTAPLPFNISVAYSGNSAYQSYFTQAAQRWQQVITTDLPDAFSSLYGSIDDLLIHVSVVSIDGVGGILGQAGPDQFRSSGLPYHGIIQLDLWDVAAMASNGTLLSVVTHEMGHVLGLGTLWSSFGLRSGSSYVGGNAVNAYHQLGGSGSTIPLETGGGSGTAFVHWSDAVFGNELMTGYISSTSNPLSIMTVGSLQDMGYRVNYAAADAYSIPGRLEAGAPGAVSSDQHASALDLHDHDHGDMAHGIPDFVLDPLTEWTIII